LISGIILSAGKSSRMEGLIKPLLKFKGKTFIETIIESMQKAGLDEIIVVLGANKERILSEVDIKDKVVFNENWQEGQISSLREGILNVKDRSEGIIFTPVDHPVVKENTYKKLIERKGHPTIFPRRFFNKILNGNLENGARDIIRNNINSVKYVPVDDEGVIIDIDTIFDYKKFVEKK